jgi:hypothetical protein
MLNLENLKLISINDITFFNGFNKSIKIHKFENTKYYTNLGYDIKYIKEFILMILILLLFLLATYIKLGAFVLIQIIIWLIVFISSNFLIGINPSNIQFKITRILSVCVIVFLLWFNSLEISVHTTMLLPLSIVKISYVHEFDSLIYISDSNTKEERLYLWNYEEIKDFLNSLDIDDNYIVNMEFIPSDEDMYAPQLILSKPFLINRHSSVTTIMKFINERLDYMIEFFYLDDIVIQPNPDIVGPMVKLTYNKINIL